jgi:hypothetical protein
MAIIPVTQNDNAKDAELRVYGHYPLDSEWQWGNRSPHAVMVELVGSLLMAPIFIMIVKE